MSSPSLGEMMAAWFASMQASIDGLNKTQMAVLAELQAQTEQLKIMNQTGIGTWVVKKP